MNFISILGILKFINVLCCSFRLNWPLDNFGKWAENEFTSSIYPAFACGSGNLLSRKLVDWIAMNSEHLHFYQVLSFFIMIMMVVMIFFISINFAENFLTSLLFFLGHFSYF